MVTGTKIKAEVRTCEWCGHKGTDVHLLQGKETGSDRMLSVWVCDDWKACLERMGK